MWINERIIRIMCSRKMKFEDIAIKWLENKKNSIKLSTYSKYDYTINKYLLPSFKGKSLYKLKNYNFNNFVNELNTGLSPKSIRDILCVLKAILYYAEEEYGCIFRKKKMVVPKMKKENLVILNVNERNRLEKTCIEDNSLAGLAIIIAINTGMRIGEICALQWKNIDIERREIYVKYTLQRIYDGKKRKTKIILDKPKTSNSIRSIPISNKLYERLEPMKKIYEDDAFFDRNIKIY